MGKLDEINAELNALDWDPPLRRLKLPTMAEVAASRVGKPLPKGPTRLERVVEAKKLTTIDEREFKRQVWERDKNHCRCCKRKVQKVMGRVPERGEVHHINGRGKDLRFEVRAALLLCLTCHERVTGRVNDKLAIIPTKTFTMREHAFTDATSPVTFKRIA